ncbi:hypothetical protein M231_07023 [Tremella mesenterica]|uniref:Uncharacterized protein n=1 Tax=Tremella mesenterica TaxID=5217 RepID=A0A4Q1BD50_TREME|nr:hypothetical protein M231_07023 [Tremella mesenterica]
MAGSNQIKPPRRKRTWPSTFLLLILLSRRAGAQYIPPYSHNLKERLELARPLDDDAAKFGGIRRPQERDGDSQTSNNPNLWLISHDDFCLYGPTDPFNYIWNTGTNVVSWCSKAGHGTRLIPDGTLHGVTYVKAQSWMQVSGTGDFTKINIAPGDAGGQFDPGKAPAGANVYTSNDNQAASSWVTLISDSIFCLRVCTNPAFCPNTYDQMGCYFLLGNSVGSDGQWQDCSSDDGDPPGVVNGVTYTQGQDPTPSPTAPALSGCSNGGSVANGQTPPPLYNWDGSGTAVPAGPTPPPSSGNGNGDGSSGTSSSSDGGDNGDNGNGGGSSGSQPSTTWIESTICTCSSSSSSSGGTAQVGVTQKSGTTSSSAPVGDLTLNKRIFNKRQDNECCSTTWVVSTITPSSTNSGTAAGNAAGGHTSQQGITPSLSVSKGGSLALASTTSGSRVSGSVSAKISGNASLGLTSGNGTNSTGGNETSWGERIETPFGRRRTLMGLVVGLVGVIGMGGWALI